MNHTVDINWKELYCKNIFCFDPKRGQRQGDLWRIYCLCCRILVNPVGL